MRTVYRACNLCEAICGLEITVDGSTVEGPKIVSIRGDARDPFSRGHICPKGVALQDIHEDPNRLRRPMRKTGGGSVIMMSSLAGLRGAAGLSG